MTLPKRKFLWVNILIILSLTEFQNCSEPGGAHKPSTLQVDNSSLGIDPEEEILTTHTTRAPNFGENEVIKTLKPTLAVRGSGCIMCHANVRGNVLTDFGHGNSYFYDGFYYTDDSGNGNWTTTTFSNSMVFVPQAKTPSNQSLVDVMSPLLRGATPQEVSGIYIGAPTADKIREVGKLAGGQKTNFISNRNTSPKFSGITAQDGGAYYTNGTKPVVCDGDLVIDGIVWLNNVTIATYSGCRIYATKSVFVSGPVTFAAEVDTQTQNLQISSAMMVAMGVGRGCRNSYNYIAGSSTHNYPAYTRERTPTQLWNEAKVDADVLGAKLKDADCEPNGQNTSFQHLLINAPLFLNNYTGDLNASIIAEVAFSSRGRVATYSFDQIFTKVPALPLLKPENYLLLVK